MNFSAAWSSSAVVTPGRAFRESSVWQRARIFPAAAILSSSSGDFLMITYRRIRTIGRRSADGGRRSLDGADPARSQVGPAGRLRRAVVARRAVGLAGDVGGHVPPGDEPPVH